MRGLPPIPPGLVHITAGWTVGTLTQPVISSSWYLEMPGAASFTPAQLETVAGDWYFNCLPQLLSVIPSPISCNLLRLSTTGPSPVIIRYEPAYNIGALSELQAFNCALCMVWRTFSDNGRPLSRTYLPLSGQMVADDNTRLTSIGWSQAQSAARGYALAMSSIISPAGGNASFVCLRRARGGYPELTTEVNAVVLGDASPRCATIGQRTGTRR